MATEEPGVRGYDRPIVQAYTLTGQRRGDALTVREVAVAPEDHPCLQGASRHLDTATGALVGEHVVLTWRGQRRQVLHRP